MTSLFLIVMSSTLRIPFDLFNHVLIFFEIVYQKFNMYVDSYKCPWAFIGCYTRFSGLQSSLGITNVNRSHNKPLELIETI